MQKKDFNDLVNEVKKNDYIKKDNQDFYIKLEDIENLKKKGFIMNEKIVNKLLDYFIDNDISIKIKHDQKIQNEVINKHELTNNYSNIWILLSVLFVGFFVWLFFSSINDSKYSNTNNIDIYPRDDEIDGYGRY
jgi:hypothetical protein